jgi:hypothetical protein
MTHTAIIETLRARLSMPGGRHLYGVLGTYRLLNAFSNQLIKAKAADGTPLPKPVSVNRGILDTIPDEEFRKLVNGEAKRPEPTAARVGAAFEQFIRSKGPARHSVHYEASPHQSFWRTVDRFWNL